MKKKYVGFTLVEVLVVLAVIGVITAFSIVGWQYLIDRATLKAATEEFYDAFKLGHAESINKNRIITVSFQQGANWCIALSDNGNCNCGVSGSCLIGGVERVVSHTKYNNVLATGNFASTPGTFVKNIAFDGARGTSSDAGSIELSLSNYSATVSLNKIGLTTICSDSIVGYPSCTP